MLKTFAEMRGLLTGIALIGVLSLVAISMPMGAFGEETLSSLRFHLGFATGLLALLLCATGAGVRGLIIVALVLLSLAQSAAIVIEQQSRRDAFAGAVVSGSFKMLSYNVLGNNARDEDAARYIIDTNADVVVLMEARGIASNLPEIDAHYPYRIGCEKVGSCDLVILSKQPFLSTRQLTLHSIPRQRLTSVRVSLGNDTPVTIIAAHMTKPYFDDLARSDFSQLNSFIKTAEGAIVIAGDFNAAAWSGAVSRLAAAAELVPPPTYPATWPVELGPLGVPIDNMFTSGPALISKIVSSSDSFGSNHLGLLATIDLF